LKTPCIKVCVMDLDTNRCRGCYRSLEEIGRWGSMTDAERDAVMAELPERKRADASSDVAKVSVPPLA
jgi:predicted Fe-S protein YdhL (DUF1289 family)